jgi:hypothetical protein
LTIFYPDISSAQEGIDLKGATAVCAKATQGTGYVNPDYARAKANAASHGVFFFAYHFLEAGNAAAQAAHCHSVVAGLTSLMVDVEITGTSRPSVADTQEFVDAYRKLGGVCYLVYLPRWYWSGKPVDGCLGSPDLSGLHSRGLRLVSSAYTTYSDSKDATGWQPYGGMTPTIWQYTSSAQFNGKTVDLNAFRGTLLEFGSIVTTGKMPPPAPVRHVVPAGNTQTLEGVARQRNVAVEHLVSLSTANLNPQNLAVLNAYLALDNALHTAARPRPAMPEGLVYYTSN